MPERTKRVAELIRREVSQIVSKEIYMGNVFVTFTRIEISGDIRYADIYFSVIPDIEQEKTMVVLNKNIFTIQQFLNKRLRMRPVPQIRFHIDETEKEARKIDKIIEGL